MGIMESDAVTAAVICIVTAFVCLTLRGTEPGFAALAALAGGLFATVYAVGGLRALAEAADSAAQTAGIPAEVFEFAIKGVGLGWLTGLTADTARQAGEEGVAKKAEMAGKISVLLLCVPVARELLSNIASLFGN